MIPDLSQEIEGFDKVLVVFGAEWCSPCRSLKKQLEMKREFFEDTRIVFLDIEEDYDLFAQYDITSVPTLVFYKKGKEVAKGGYEKRNEIFEMISE
jgi:thioredoxin 1